VFNVNWSWILIRRSNLQFKTALSWTNAELQWIVTINWNWKRVTPQSAVMKWLIAIQLEATDQIQFPKIFSISPLTGVIKAKISKIYFLVVIHCHGVSK